MVDEQARLEQADRHIRESRVRIADQESLVRSLIADGHDATDAEAILQTFRETLVQFLDHRALIVEAMQKQADRARSETMSGVAAEPPASASAVGSSGRVGPGGESPPVGDPSS